MRWVHQYSPEIAKKIRRHSRPTNDLWRVDETYIKVKGEWKYLYRAVDSDGDTIDFMLSTKRDRKDPSKENPIQVINDLIRLINPTDHIGVIYVFMSNDPGGVDENAKKGEYILPFEQLWEKGISVGTGQTSVKGIHLMLRDMIIREKAKPSFIVSHRISLDEVPDAYRKFDQRTNGYTKVIIKPQN